MFSAAFPPYLGRVRSRAVRFAVLIGLATTALALAPQVASAASGTYTAAVSPNVAQVSTSSTFTVTFKNTSSAGEIKTLSVTFPSGFTVTGVGTTSPATWTVSHSGNTVTLSGVLKPGASVSIPITATAPATTGLFKLITSASSPAGTFTRTGGDPSITVAQTAAVVPCNPGASCASPTLSVGGSPTATATDSQVTGQPGSNPDLLTVVLPDPTSAPLLCQPANGTFGQIVTWNVTARTSVLVYTIHAPNSLHTYGLSDTCFGSTQPFPGAVQNPNNGNEFEGTLQSCKTTAPPCVDSITSSQTGQGNDPETVVFKIHAPQGDPKFTG